MEGDATELRLGQICAGLSEMEYSNLMAFAKAVTSKLMKASGPMAAPAIADALYEAACQLLEDGYE